MNFSEQPSSSRCKRQKIKHPAHLKGKQIGLFYARQKWKKDGNSEDVRPRKDFFKKCVGSILLSDNKKHKIRLLLGACDLTFNKENNDKYSNIKDSRFKKKFIETVTGCISKKLKTTSPIVRDTELDNMYYKEFEEKKLRKAYTNMQKLREKLPAFYQQEEILNAINENQVLLISGETGCGKTTQVAQFILDDYLKKKSGSMCHICCTQPRRISAFSIAARVASERDENLGESIGYSIRLENKLPRKTGSAVFCTTGMVLKEMENDPSLQNISHLILDEVHERDVFCDVLLPILKQVIHIRKDLKLILMSATLNAEKFSEYFNNCKVLHIPGLMFPVEEFFLEDVIQKTHFQFPNCTISNRNEIAEYSEFIEPYLKEIKNRYSKDVCYQLANPMCEKINLDLIMELIIHICKKEGEGAILVFLPGYGDISKLFTLLENSSVLNNDKYIIIPLHSQMPSVNQKNVFETAPEGKRKIVLSTNIAETSVTIDDVVFVIDCGRIKITQLHIETNFESLESCWVSLANAHQRRGRAGRVKAGICYHLISKARYKTLADYIKPQILRKRLEDIVLSIKILQLGQAEEFLNSLLDAPEKKAIQNSIELLKRLNALDEDENLTPLGYHLARLPMNPQLGKMILLGALFGCLDPILTIAATLDFKDPFYIPLGKEKQADEKRFQFAKGWKSDHLALLEVMYQFEACGKNYKNFCYNNFLSYHTLNLLNKMKKQYVDYLYEANFVKDRNPASSFSNYNSSNLSLIKALVCSGLYPNVVLLRNRNKKFGNKRFINVNNEDISLNIQSILNRYTRFESPLFVYYKRMKNGRTDYIYDASMIFPLPLVFFGDRFEYIEENNFSFISINDRFKFKCSQSTSSAIQEMRNKLNWLLEYKISNPGYIDWVNNGEETLILHPIIELITNEDVEDYDLDDFDDE